MNDESETSIALFSLYLATAEKVSERRAQANTWMLSVNSAVVGLYGYLGTAGGADGRAALLWAIPAAGTVVCIAWAALLESYRKLNAAKFHVLQAMERGFAHRMFRDEDEHYRRAGRRALSRLEGWIPWSFAALHLCILAVQFLR